MIKYSPLIVGLFIVFGFIPQLITDHPEVLQYSWIELIILLAFSVLFFILFFNMKDKLNYVAVGKAKIIIKKSGREVEHSWLDVESITLNRFWGLYKLKIKDENKIYFTAYGRVTWLTGDDSDMGVIINKMKKELQI